MRAHTVGRERRELLGVADIFQFSRTSRELRALYKLHGTFSVTRPLSRLYEDVRGLCGGAESYAGLFVGSDSKVIAATPHLSLPRTSLFCFLLSRRFYDSEDLI